MSITPLPMEIRIKLDLQFELRVWRRGDSERSIASACVHQPICENATAEKLVTFFGLKGNPPALLEDFRSFAAPGVAEQPTILEPLKIYEKMEQATVRKS